MDKALVFGTKDCRFESCQGHFLLNAGGRAANERESKSVPMDKAFALHSEDCEFAQMLPHGLEPWTFGS